MKKIYTAIILSLSCTLSIGQTLVSHPGNQEVSKNTIDRRTNNNRGGGAIWSDDFSGGNNPSATEITTSAGTWNASITDNGDIWKHSIYGPSGCFSTNVGIPEFTTAGNGFLLFDADSANCLDPSQDPPLFNQNQWSGSIVSPQIDLTGYQDVVLYFEYATRWCCNDQFITYALSSDNGATWSDEQEIISPNVNIVLQSSMEVVVSGFVANSSQVRVRFSWGIDPNVGQGSGFYFLAIDDVAFYPQPSDDVVLMDILTSQIDTAEIGDIQYHRIPQSQLGSQLQFNVRGNNFGTSAQSIVLMDVDVQNSLGATVASGSSNLLNVAAGDTFTISTSASISNLPIDVYTANYSITSSGDVSGGAEYDDNTLGHNFAITENRYSIDGLGIHDQPVLTDIGTNSYTGAEDDFGMFTAYEIVGQETLSGVEILLDPIETFPGAYLYATLHTLEDILNNDPGNWLAESDDYYVITQADIDAGFVFIPFSEPYNANNEIVYAGILAYSDGNSYDLQIYDDLTVEQPWWASMISIDAQIYIVGNALAIRLTTCVNGNVVSVSECDSYDWNGNTYASSGIYSFVDPTGECETLDLTVLDGGTTFLDYDLCAGESINVGGTNYSASGQYTQIETASNGCDSTINIDVFVETEPTTNILGNIAVAPNSVETYAIVQPGGYTITWSVTNGTILSGQGSNSISVFWDATGGGEVTLTLANSICSYTYTLPVGTFVGIENHWITDLQIHPNPSTGIFNMELTEPTLIIVMDARGRKIVETNGNGQFSLDLNGFSKGTYIVQVQTSKGLYSEKLILQ